MQEEDFTILVRTLSNSEFSHAQRLRIIQCLKRYKVGEPQIHVSLGEYYCFCPVLNRVHETQGFYLQNDGTWAKDCFNGWFKSEKEIQTLLETCEHSPQYFNCDRLGCSCTP